MKMFPSIFIYFTIMFFIFYSFYYKIDKNKRKKKKHKPIISKYTSIPVWDKKTSILS